MSIYGEGIYRDSANRLYEKVERSRAALARGDWEVRNDAGEALRPVPTPETKPPSLASIYALSKYCQEQACLLIGKAYGIPTVALRFFNVYGPRQALSNPYTGVLAIFASRILNNNAPLIYEDGKQMRDFVSVHDVARACRLALESPEAPGQVMNIASGTAYSITEIAECIIQALGKPALLPKAAGKYRVGDIRHCFADNSLARRILKFAPQVSLHNGITELADWLTGQQVVDHALEADAELTARGLTV